MSIEIPDSPKTREEEYLNAILQAIEAGGGGGHTENDIFLVTFTRNSLGGISSDKSVQEILEAVTAGKAPCGLLLNTNFNQSSTLPIFYCIPNQTIEFKEVVPNNIQNEDGTLVCNRIYWNFSSASWESDFVSTLKLPTYADGSADGKFLKASASSLKWESVESVSEILSDSASASQFEQIITMLKTQASSSSPASISVPFPNGNYLVNNIINTYDSAHKLPAFIVNNHVFMCTGFLRGNSATFDVSEFDSSDSTPAIYNVRMVIALSYVVVSVEKINAPAFGS